MGRRTRDRVHTKNRRAAGQTFNRMTRSQDAGLHAALHPDPYYPNLPIKVVSKEEMEKLTSRRCQSTTNFVGLEKVHKQKERRKKVNRKEMIKLLGEMDPEAVREETVKVYIKNGPLALIRFCDKQLGWDDDTIKKEYPNIKAEAEKKAPGNAEQVKETGGNGKNKKAAATATAK